MSSGVYNTLNIVSSSKHYNLWIYNNLKKHISGDVLDIGSGLGDIAHHYTKGNVNRILLSDYSQEMIPELNKKFTDDRFHVCQLDIAQENSMQVLDQESVDTITCINVLEHIHDDVKALQNMKRILRKNGKVVILVPALPWLYGSLDILVEHCRRYTKKTLRQVLVEAGFVVKEQYYKNFWGIFTWFMAGRVLRHKEFNKKNCASLDQIVPYLEQMEKVWTPPLGQSLISVGVKDS